MIKIQTADILIVPVCSQRLPLFSTANNLQNVQKQTTESTVIKTVLQIILFHHFCTLSQSTHQMKHHTANLYIL